MLNPPATIVEMLTMTHLVIGLIVIRVAVVVYTVIKQHKCSYYPYTVKGFISFFKGYVMLRGYY